MSENDENDGYGLPLIPLSELRVLYQKAFLYLNQGGFGEKELARIMVAVEINGRLANQWYEKAEKLEAENIVLKEAVAKAYNAIAAVYLQDILLKVEKYIHANREDENKAGIESQGS